MYCTTAPAPKPLWRDNRVMLEAERYFSIYETVQEIKILYVYSIIYKMFVLIKKKKKYYKPNLVMVQKLAITNLQC